MYDFDWRTVALAASLHWRQPALSAPASFDNSDAKSDTLQVPADLQLPAPSILPHLSMQAQWVKDRFVSLVTVAEMDMVLVVHEVRRDGGIYLDAASSGSFAPVSTTERYATPPRSTPRPSP